MLVGNRVNVPSGTIGLKAANSSGVGIPNRCIVYSATTISSASQHSSVCIETPCRLTLLSIRHSRWRGTERIEYGIEIDTPLRMFQPSVLVIQSDRLVGSLHVRLICCSFGKDIFAMFGMRFDV